jgi:hypothetical protein
MASSQAPKGKGRARPITHSSEPPPPSVTSRIDASVSTTPATVDTTSSCVTPATDVAVAKTPTTTDTSRPESGFSSASSSFQPSTTATPTVSGGRGRGTHLKRNVVTADPFWTVTNLTNADFYSSDRPKKPDELGSLGQQIKVIVNYFPILQFPHKGLVYRYQIQIRNKKNFEIHRDRRR